MYAVEHGGLYRRVVYHILKGYDVTDVEWGVETPCSHEVTRQAAVAAYAVCKRQSSLFHGALHRSAHFRLVGHFQTVGHVAGETRIDYGGLYALVLHNVLHSCHQHASLPCKGTARFEYNVQVGIPVVYTIQYIHKQTGVITVSCHKVTAAEINPFQLVKPPPELAFYV